MLPELRDTSVIIFVVVGIQMIKDRHLGVSRDAIRSVWKSHLPGCSDREKYVMWRHAFNVKVTFACLLGQRCHAFSVKVTFACLFGQWEIWMAKYAILFYYDYCGHSFPVLPCCQKASVSRTGDQNQWLCSSANDNNLEDEEDCGHFLK